MSALYIMRYVGAAGTGHGLLYIGRGVILGADAGNGRYTGEYQERHGQIEGTGVLTAPAGTFLVTGTQVAEDTTLPFTAKLPRDFANGAVHHVLVGGVAVGVTFEKLGDVP